MTKRWRRWWRCCDVIITWHRYHQWSRVDHCLPSSQMTLHLHRNNHSSATAKYFPPWMHYLVTLYVLHGSIFGPIVMSWLGGAIQTFNKMAEILWLMTRSPGYGLWTNITDWGPSATTVIVLRRSTWKDRYESTWQEGLVILVESIQMKTSKLKCPASPFWKTRGGPEIKNGLCDTDTDDALFGVCIHQINRMNSQNGLSWWQHYKYHLGYYYYLASPLRVTSLDFHQDNFGIKNWSA